LERTILIARTYNKDTKLCFPAKSKGRIYGEEKCTPEQVPQDESRMRNPPAMAGGTISPSPFLPFFFWLFQAFSGKELREPQIKGKLFSGNNRFSSYVLSGMWKSRAIA
jgi:hypothetical protein